MNSRFPIALHILGFLASRGGEPLTSEVMAETDGTSSVVLRRGLAKLKRAQLVDTRRWVSGGSVLARSPEAINLLRIAAILWLVWGAVHILAGVMTIKGDTTTAIQGIADAVEPSTIIRD